MECFLPILLVLPFLYFLMLSLCADRDKHSHSKDAKASKHKRDASSHSHAHARPPKHKASSPPRQDPTYSPPQYLLAQQNRCDSHPNRQCAIDLMCASLLLPQIQAQAGVPREYCISPFEHNNMRILVHSHSLCSRLPLPPLHLPTLPTRPTCLPSLHRACPHLRPAHTACTTIRTEAVPCNDLGSLFVCAPCLSKKAMATGRRRTQTMTPLSVPPLHNLNQVLPSTRLYSQGNEDEDTCTKAKKRAKTSTARSKYTRSTRDILMFDHHDMQACRWD